MGDSVMRALSTLGGVIILAASGVAIADPVDDYLVSHGFRAAPGAATTIVSADGSTRELAADERYLVDSGFMEDPAQFLREQGEVTIRKEWVATSDPVSEAPIG
jgi:hypothetical protein